MENNTVRTVAVWQDDVPSDADDSQDGDEVAQNENEKWAKWYIHKLGAIISNLTCAVLLFLLLSSFLNMTGMIEMVNSFTPPEFPATALLTDGRSFVAVIAVVITLCLVYGCIQRKRTVAEIAARDIFPEPQQYNYVVNNLVWSMDNLSQQTRHRVYEAVRTAGNPEEVNAIEVYDDSVQRDETDYEDDI